MKVITDPNQVEKQWSAFVYNHQYGNIFQTHEMYQVYKQTKNYEPLFISIVDAKDDIIGTLLAVILKEHNGILGHLSARSIIWGGPLIKDNNFVVLNNILNEYKKRIKGKAIYTQFRNQWDWSMGEKDIFIKNEYSYEEHLDILIDLKRKEDELLMKMHKGRRKNIGRAEREPLKFSEIEDVNDFDKCLKLIEDTYKRVKLPCPNRSFFYNTDNNFRNGCTFRKFVAKFQDNIISCRFVLCYKGLVYDWFAGTDENHLDKYPNDYLPCKILQWAKINGYNTFDFGGAGKPNKPYGVREYKLKFGGELVNFGRFECIHDKILIKIGHLGLKVFKLLQ